jgi:signal transduction histidine kinase
MFPADTSGGEWGSGVRQGVERSEEARSAIATRVSELAQIVHRLHETIFIPVDLRIALINAVREQEDHARQRDVTLWVELRSAPTTLGWPRAIERAISNLVDNAIEHSPSGGRVDVSLDDDGKFGSIEVHDRGPGIPAPLRERAFEPSFSTREGAAGLGLAVARSIATVHGGRVEFVDDDEGGARVRLELAHRPRQCMKRRTTPVVIAGT